MKRCNKISLCKPVNLFRYAYFQSTIYRTRPQCLNNEASPFRYLNSLAAWSIHGSGRNSWDTGKSKITRRLPSNEKWSSDPLLGVGVIRSTKAETMPGFKDRCVLILSHGLLDRALRMKVSSQSISSMKDRIRTRSESTVECS